MDESDDAASYRADWSAGLADACKRIRIALADGAPSYRHRMHAHLLKGLPADSGSSQAAFRHLRLLLIRGFGSDWRKHVDERGEPDVWELLYLGLPRLADLAEAIGLLAERAHTNWSADCHGRGRGGSREDDLRRSLMMHLCAIYRDLFGRLPSVSDVTRRERSPLRCTFPGGPSHDWFAELFLHLEGERPPADALKTWINSGNATLAAAEAQRAADELEFPE